MDNISIIFDLKGWMECYKGCERSVDYVIWIMDTDNNAQAIYCVEKK